MISTKVIPKQNNLCYKTQNATELANIQKATFNSCYFKAWGLKDRNY